MQPQVLVRPSRQRPGRWSLLVFGAGGDGGHGAEGGGGGGRGTEAAGGVVEAGTWPRERSGAGVGTEGHVRPGRHPGQDRSGWRGHCGLQSAAPPATPGVSSPLSQGPVNRDGKITPQFLSPPPPPPSSHAAADAFPESLCLARRNWLRVNSEHLIGSDYNWVERPGLLSPPLRTRRLVRREKGRGESEKREKRHPRGPGPRWAPCSSCHLTGFFKLGLAWSDPKSGGALGGPA